MYHCIIAGRQYEGVLCQHIGNKQTKANWGSTEKRWRIKFWINLSNLFTHFFHLIPFPSQLAGELPISSSHCAGGEVHLRQVAVLLQGYIFIFLCKNNFHPYASTQADAQPEFRKCSQKSWRENASVWSLREDDQSPCQRLSWKPSGSCCACACEVSLALNIHSVFSSSRSHTNTVGLFAQCVVV